MTGIITEFYNVITSTVQAAYHSFPISITSVLYDPMFTPPHISQGHMWSRKSDRFYKYLFDDLYKLTLEKSDDPEKQMVYICDSADIKEDPARADYLYYYGRFNFNKERVAILYMNPSHPMAYPASVRFYGLLYQIDVWDDMKSVNVYEVNSELRNRFFIDPQDIRRAALEDMLKNTDRPQLIGRG